MSADIEVFLAFVGIAPFAADTSAVVDIFPAADICPPFGFYQALLADISAAVDISALVDIFVEVGISAPVDICLAFGFYQAWLAGTSLAVLHIVVVGQHIFLLSAPFGLVSGLVSRSAV